MLIGLALACLAPVTAALVYSGLTDYSGDHARVKLFVQALVRANAARTARVLADAKNALATLTTTASLSRVAPGRCAAVSDEYMRLTHALSTRDETYSALMVLDGTGQLVCAAYRSVEDAPAPSGNVLRFDRVAREGALVLGYYATVGASGSAVPLVAAPLAHDGSASEGYVAVGISPDALDSEVRMTPKSNQFHYGTIAAGGSVWAVPAPVGARHVGHALADDAVARLRAVGDGVLEGDLGDGHRRVYGVAPVAGTVLHAYLSIPFDVAFGQDEQDSMRVVAFGVINLVVAAWAAIVLSRRISSPVRALAESAEELLGGATDRRAPSDGPLETRRVAHAFNALVDAWQSSQRKLAESAADLDDLYQNAPCGYHSHDAAGMILRINDTELRWLGYSRDDIGRGTHIHLLLTDKGRREFDAALSDFVRTGMLSGLELEYRRKDGSVLPCMVHASAVFDSGGRFVASRSTLIDLTERRAMEREVAARATHAAKLSRHLMSVEEDARRKLSAELHDRTSANVATLRTQLTVLKERLVDPAREDVVAMFEDCGAVLEDTNRSLREVCADLRPPLLDRAGLARALEAYVTQFARRTGLHVTFDHVPLPARLPPDAESNLFRIAQEALTNAAKHSGADSIAVALKPVSGGVVLSVRDDGAGFDPGQASAGAAGGLGLMTMRDRAEFIGGSLQLRSTMGAGTEVRVELRPA